MTLLTLAQEIVMRPDIFDKSNMLGPPTKNYYMVWCAENLPPIVQRWTTTPPTVPGHYWGYDPAGYCDIVHVVSYPHDWQRFKAGQLVVQCEDGNYPIETWTIYWLGPLPVPDPPVSADSQTP